MLRKTWISRLLTARQHISMVLLWRQLDRKFPMFAYWNRPSARRGYFDHLAQSQHPLLWAFSTAESLSYPEIIGSIGGLTIFQGQQYSSCSKAGGWWAAQLPRGFRKNLLIVICATPTPGCAANFPRNWYSQPYILRLFGRSAQELPVEYHVEALFIKFSESSSKKCCRQGPGSGNLLHV